MSPAVKIVSSENLVTNQGHRKDFGAKVDSLEECLHVIEKGLKNMKNAGEVRYFYPYYEARFFSYLTWFNQPHATFVSEKSM